jgi:outer membrane protein assembly factor BamB
LVVGLAVFGLAVASFLQVAWAEKVLLPAQPPVVVQPVAPIAPGGPFIPGPGGPGGPGGPAADPTEFGEGISLPKDNQLSSKIEAAHDYIATEDWKQATELLQHLIEIPADVFAQLPRKAADGKETKIWTSVRGEAKRILATLPRKGMEFYKLTYGPTAEELLKKARETGDPTKLAEVMRRFLYTDSGGEAANLLATYYLDRADYTASALCFKRLIERDGLGKIEKNVLFKAAYAFHQVGDQKNEDEAWKELSTRGGAVRLGSKNQSVEELQKFVGSLVRTINEYNRLTWPIFGGNSSRNGKAEGDTAFMEARWRAALASFEATKEKVKSASDYLVEKQQPLLSSFYPITATATKDGQRIPLVIFRSYSGLSAYNVKTGQRIWDARSWWSLDSLYRSTGKVQYAISWSDYYFSPNNKTRPSIFFDNSTVGAISSDNTLVYVVDDLAVPPPPAQGNIRPGGQPGAANNPMGEMMESSRLQAFNVATGKLVWEQGASKDGAAELKDSYFLGPPLPIAGKVYALIEKQQELKLAELEAASGKLLKLQPLATTKDKMTTDINRRINAAHLSYGEGMLICPTNAGAVLCIDVLENSLVWAYPYQETRAPDPNAPGVAPGIGRKVPPGGIGIGPDGRPLKPVATDGWRSTAPIIQGGKVYFTAPDAQSIHCINLADGSRVWSHRRTEDDLYMGGVYGNKVLIVGRRSVRALDALKGEVLWTVPTGMPSGMGICSDNIYYLPLREGLESKEPEIFALDIERGALHAHTKSRKKEVPGNLLFFEGDVISQTTAEVAVYPQLRVKLAQIDERIAKDGSDPIGLVERGELRLDKGDLPGAVEDLNKALQQPNIPKDLVAKAEEKLFETLTDFLQRDFNAAEKYLDTYKKLCVVKVPEDATPEVKAEKAAEQRRRQANYLCLVAKGREAQRRLVEAFEHYQEFAAFAGTEERITVVDEPAVQAAPDVWTQGRITAMMRNATEAERRPLEAKVQEKWEAMKKTATLADLRKFVAVFGAQFPAGKEARLALADKLIQSKEPDAMLDAERHLNLLRGKGEDRNLVGRATECLARLATEKGLLDDAAYFYDILGRQYGDVVIGDSTGADIFNELATDKRLLLQMDRVGKIPVAKNWKVTEDRNSYPTQGNTYLFEHVGENLPFFERWQLAMRMDINELKLIDKLGTEEKREERIIRKLDQQTYIQNIAIQLQQHANNQRNYNQPRLGFQSLGHLTVMQLGPMVYAIDPVTKRVLWEKNLLAGLPATGTGSSGSKPPIGVPVGISFGTDPDGTPTVQFQEGFIQRLGAPALLDSGVVCLQMRDALMAVDPITGRTLWTRGDVRSSARIFCDDGHVFIVEMGPTGNPAATRVLRLADGVTVPKLPDFSGIYGKKSRMVGRNILYVEPGPAGGQVAKLYDPLKGEDVWSQTLTTGAIVLQSMAPDLFGAIEFDPATPAEGKLTVTNLRDRKLVLNSKVETRHVEKMLSIALHTDGKDYYILCNGPMNPALARFGGVVQPPIMLNQGMRALAVNGFVYAFNGETGQRRWFNRIEDQMLILDRFEDMPLMLFASRYNRFAKGAGMQVINVLEVWTINKGTGKLIYGNNSDATEDRKDSKFQPLPQGMNFHQLHINPAEGKVEFVGYNMKIVYQVDVEAK